MPLSEIQLRAVPMLLAGASNRAAAKKLGVDPCTVSRWNRQPEFKRALHDAADLAFKEATLILKRAARRAAVRLANELKAKSPDRWVVSAARETLSIAKEYHAAFELTARVEALEAANGESTPALSSEYELCERS